jgi:hypothetical protein
LTLSAVFYNAETDFAAAKRRRKAKFYCCYTHNKAKKPTIISGTKNTWCIIQKRALTPEAGVKNCHYCKIQWGVKFSRDVKKLREAPNVPKRIIRQKNEKNGGGETSLAYQEHL